MRWQATLDWLIAQKTGGRTQNAGLQDLLRLGLYQIFWLDRIPDHAAVHETVELAKRNGYGSQSGFVNAVLRGYLREQDETRKLLADLKISQPALGWSHPDWLVARWQKLWGAERTAESLEWNNTPPKTFARVNTLRTDATQLIKKWSEEKVDYDFKTFDWTGENLVFELKSHPPLALLGSFQQGWFYLQDPSTLLAVRELDPQPDEAILDLCSAPGGKATYAAQLVNNQARIVAEDVSPERLKLVQENCTRLGVTCVKAEVSDLARPHPDPLPQEREQLLSVPGISASGPANPAPSSSEARRTNLPFPGGEGRGEGDRKHTPSTSHFDKILLDAPCSNTGVMRRRADLRWRIRPEEIERLRATQLDLLHQAAARLKPSGTLIYSTCSLEPQENREVVSEFLAAHPGFRQDYERMLTPFENGVDGAFVSRLRRV